MGFAGPAGLEVLGWAPSLGLGRAFSGIQGTDLVYIRFGALLRFIQGRFTNHVDISLALANYDTNDPSRRVMKFGDSKIWIT